MSKREGIYVGIWLIHFIVRWKLTQYCKTGFLKKYLLPLKKTKLRAQEPSGLLKLSPGSIAGFPIRDMLALQQICQGYPVQTVPGIPGGLSVVPGLAANANRIMVCTGHCGF